MIPLRVTMSGWMRYREPQTVDFTGARLISVCGENGAGKSSIFDAITFALFGRQRLGNQHVEELISEGAEQCAVEYEFEQEGRRYRVRRTRGRRASLSSQGLWAWDESVNDWVVVPNSQYARGLEKALEAVVRITPQAFTSSFLLQQGAATEFLEAKGADRFAVISSLVNLDAYQVLEEKARRAQRVEAGEVQRLTTKLTDYDGVEAASLTLLRDRLAEADARLQALQGERERAKRLLDASAVYARLLRDLDEVSRHLEAAAELLAEAPQIEADARYFSTLASAVSTVERMREELDAAATAEEDVRSIAAALAASDSEAFRGRLADATARLVVAAADVERLSAAREAAVVEERAAADFLALAQRIMAFRRQLAQHRAEVARIDAEVTQLTVLESETSRRRALAAALPALSELGSARKRLEPLVAKNPAAMLSALQRDHDASLTRLSACDTSVAEAWTALDKAQRAASALRAECGTVAQQLSRRQEAAGEAVCSRCGQRVDAAQAQRELTALMEQAAVVEQRAISAEHGAEQARATHAEAVQQRESCAEALRTAAIGIATAKSKVEELEEAASNERERRAAFFDIAPDALRERVAASKSVVELGVVYKECQAETASIQQREAELRRLHGVQGSLGRLQDAIKQVQHDLTDAENNTGERLTEVPDAAVRHERALRILDEQRTALAVARDEERAARSAEAAARDALNDALQRRQALVEKQRIAELAAAGHRRTFVQIGMSLDASLREHAQADPLATLTRLRRDQERLADAPARLNLLNTARGEQTRLGGVRDTLNKSLERIPEEERVSQDVAKETWVAAEAKVSEAATWRDHCQREVIRMERDLDDALAMRTALTVAETRSERLKRLALLLGKTGLQGALVSESLETVMSHANSFLARLTGGSLLLNLERGDGDALELKAVDTTCMREARSVQVLSGSQKFRCAVAIASGIGQYAGAGGMRSIVIDEGFGSLDETGQHMIIGELKNLAGHMDRVIVVSHLDAFRSPDHFPDQIRVIRAGDGSRVERMI